MTGLKGCKNYQEKQIFHFPYLKENWLKNEWNLSNQSGEATYASIYLMNCRRSFIFFSITLFRAWFYKWFPLVSQRGNHLSVLYDKIPVFYALKYPKFTIITFYRSAWRPNRLLTLLNCTLSLLDRLRILTIFSITWQYQAQTWR